MAHPADRILEATHKRGSAMIYVSIIICTYNRAVHLGRVLDSFRYQNVDEPTELIVVDNNSDDHTGTVVAQAKDALKDSIAVSYVFEPVQGLSVARNAGIDAARGEILAFLDDDATPDPGWLQAMTRFFRANAQVNAIGGPVRPGFETDPPKWLTPGLHGLYSLIDLGDTRKPFPENKFPIGANMAFRREVFDCVRFTEELGRKGETLISREETEIFLKLRQKGKPILYVEGMSVRHFVPKSRMTKQWIYHRSYHEGISLALSEKRGNSRSLVFRCLFYALVNYIPRPRYFNESMVCHNARFLIFLGALLHVFLGPKLIYHSQHA